MSGGQRLLLIIGTVLLLGAGLVLLSPGDEDDSDTNAVTTATAPAVTTDAPAATTSTAAPAPPPAPAFETIEVRGGKPVGGVKTISAKSGDRVRIEVRSSDTSDEVHLHGYDIKRDLEAGGRVRFSFEADAEGIFEMELEGSATQIAKLEVKP